MRYIVLCIVMSGLMLFAPASRPMAKYGPGTQDEIAGTAAPEEGLREEYERVFPEISKASAASKSQTEQNEKQRICEEYLRIFEL